MAEGCIKPERTFDILQLDDSVTVHVGRMPVQSG